MTTTMQFAFQNSGIKTARTLRLGKYWPRLRKRQPASERTTTDQRGGWFHPHAEANEPRN